jgi:hypothetical protein
MAALGVVLSGAALVLALVQLVRLGRMARRVETAVREQASGIAGAMLLSETGQLERIEDELRSAACSGARELAIHATLSWRRTVAEMAVMADRQLAPPAELRNALSESLKVIPATVEDLADRDTPVQEACRTLLHEMGAACVMAREAGGEIALRCR